MRATGTQILMFAAGLQFAQAASLVDTTFDIGTGANGIVEQVLQQPDGKVLICGNFTAFNGANRGYIARLNSDGSVDLSFNAGPGYWVRHMSLDANGKIVIGGFFKNVEGTTRNLIARLNTNGSLDDTFNPGAGCEEDIAPGIDGNADPFVMWCEVLPNGKILAVGNFKKYGGVSSMGIVSINADGSRDTVFNIGGGLDSWGRVIKPLANGQILVGGWFQNYNGHTANRLTRLNADGTPDPTFNTFYGDSTAVYSIVQQSNGQLITSGHSLNKDGLFHREVERLNLDGTVDSTWPGYTNEKTESLLLLANGKVVAAGYFSLVNGEPRRGLARFNADGSLDTTFTADADNYVWTIAPGGAGKILVSGGFTTIDGISRNGVARINLPEGSDGGVATPSSPTIVNPSYNGRFQCMVSSLNGFTYTLQYKTSAGSTTWNSFQSVAGTGGPITLNDPRPSAPRFYRVEVH